MGESFNPDVNGLIFTCENSFVDTIGQIETKSCKPIEYRLVKRNSEFVLQGCFHYQKGFSESRFEWEDIPTIDLGGVNESC